MTSVIDFVIQIVDGGTEYLHVFSYPNQSCPLSHTINDCLQN